MFRLIFFSLIFTPCCKYTYNKNNVKFLKLTSSELRQELLKLNRITAASTCWFTRQPFPTIFHVNVSYKCYVVCGNFRTEDLFLFVKTIEQKTFSFWSSPSSFHPHWNKFFVPPCRSRIHINNFPCPPKIYFCPPPVTLSYRRAWRSGEVLEIGSLQRNRESWQVYLSVLYCILRTYKFIWTWNS